MSNIYSNSYNNVEKKRPVSASAVVRIVIWSVVFCMLTGVLVVSLWGHSGFSLGIDGVIGYHYDDRGYQVGNGTTSQTITDLTIDWVSGSVTVTQAEGDEIVISEDFRGEEESRLRWKVEDGELTVKFCGPSWFGMDVEGDKNLTVAIPAAMLGNLDEIHVTTVSSTQDIRVSARELEIDTVSGGVTVMGTYRSVEMDTVSGNVNFDGAFKEGDFDGVSAKAKIRMREQADSLDMDTVSGDLTLILPDNTTGFRVNADSISGYVDVRDFTYECGLDDKWGDGSMEINVDSVSGKLIVEKETKD